MSVQRAEPRLKYLPALDGLRGLAVLAVMLYHAEVGFMSGGFLGVDVFFVVSGYLITSLLASEREATGALDLTRFWLRRARRLLPAALTLVFAAAAYAVVRLPEEVASLRGDVIASLGYVTNWYLVYAEKSYFEEMARPSLLRHLWSLAVEEQFYLLWPLLFTGLAKLVSRRAQILVLLALSATSALAMGVLFTPSLDPSRVYYGSDTHAMGLFLGCALALFEREYRWYFREAMGALALAGVLAMCVFVNELDPWLYRGGFALLSFATVIVISAAVDRRSRWLGKTLAAAPLRWVGLRSYSLYLWHWPVFMALRPGLDLAAEGASALALRVVLSFALAELSYRFIEAPIRRHGVVALMRALVERLSVREPVALVSAIALVCGLCGAPLVAVRMAVAQKPEPEALVLSASSSVRVNATSVTRATSTTVAPDARPASAPTVLLLGDSVMLGASRYLQRLGEGLEVDAEVGRRPLTALAILKKRKAAGTLPPVVVIHFGNNGPFNAETLDAMLAVLADAQRVVLVTARVPRWLEGFNNKQIVAAAKRHPKVVLADWHALSEGHREWLRLDGAHVNERGAIAYANLLAEHLGISARLEAPALLARRAR